MIHYNPDTRTFTLQLKASFYAFQVDPDGRLLHLAWGPWPEDVAEGRSFGLLGYDLFELSSFDRSAPRYELMTYGDVTYHEVGLKIVFPSPRPGTHDAPHAPVRDLRLRYAGHEVVLDGQPGLQPGPRPSHRQHHAPARRFVSA